jgi:ABC-type multidrug transport system fused ATPase/permease subunit
MGLVYLAIQRFYIPSSRELQRLNSVLRSPMFSHFAETLDGADTIRAFSVSKEGKRVSVETTFRQKNQEFVDGNSRAYYLSIAANRWLAVRLEMLGTIAISCSALFAVFMRGNIVAGLGGMAISYALRVTQTLNWMVRMSSQTETNIVSVERVVE